MLVLLNIYGIPDPVISNDVGVFSDEILDELFDAAVADGDASLLNALLVGAFIEELDIQDIRKAVDETAQADIRLIYDNLLDGSYKHLRSFVGQIEGLGFTYESQIMDQAEVDAILGRVPPGLSNDFGMNGLFVDLDSAGNGFDFNVHELGFTVFYYGHTSSGERLWLISQLYMEDIEYDALYALDMFEVTTGSFGNAAEGETAWGTLDITLLDCDSVSANLTGNDGSAEFDLTRLAGQQGSACQ